MTVTYTDNGRIISACITPDLINIETSQGGIIIHQIVYTFTRSLQDIQNHLGMTTCSIKNHNRF